MFSGLQIFVSEDMKDVKKLKRYIIAYPLSNHYTILLRIIKNNVCLLNARITHYEKFIRLYRLAPSRPLTSEANEKNSEH